MIIETMLATGTIILFLVSVNKEAQKEWKERLEYSAYNTTSEH